MELTILHQPQDAQQEIGQKFSISPKVEGEGLTYQWYYKVAGNLQLQKSSRTTNAYTTTMTPERNGYQVYCVITDADGVAVQTNTVTLSAAK